MVIPWKQTLATKCTVTYDKSGWVLQDHVIQSFLGTSSSVSCLDRCQENSSCYSINWFRNAGVCQLNNGTHLAYPLAPSSSGSYMLYSLRPMKALLECDVKPLGMKDKRIKDNQIKSSSYSDIKFAAHEGRLESQVRNGAAWVAQTNTAGQSLWIDLGRAYSVRNVATQGRYKVREFVRQYYLEYSQDGKSWKNVKDEGKGSKKIFYAKEHGITYNKLPSPIQAKFIKFVVMAWKINISMRVEVYGCPIP